MAAGEVRLSAVYSGTAGIMGADLPNLADANNRTWWQTTGVSYPHAVMDAGVPVGITRVRIGMLGGYEGQILNSAIQCSTTPFATLGTPPAFIQGGTNRSSSSGTTGTVTLSGTCTSTDCIIVSVLWDGVSANPTITDSAGNSYGAAITSVAGGVGKQAIYACPSIASAANDTITATFGSSTSFWQLMAIEFGGLATSALVNASAAVHASSSSSVSVPITTSAPGVILSTWVHAGGNPNFSLTPGTGFFIQLNATQAFGGWEMAGYQDAIGSNTVTATLDSARESWAITLALNPLYPVLKTFTASPNIGQLIDEFALTTSPSLFRYFRYTSGAGENGLVADLDFITQYASGATCAAVDPVISTPQGQWQFDTSVNVTITSLTTDASIYYTLDGSTPTAGSTLYTAPFVLSSTATVKAIAISSGISNSRVTSKKIYIPFSIIPTDIPQNDDRGYRTWALCPYIFKDPVSKYWYLYGMNDDQPGVYSFGYQGINVYKSADLRNWQFRGTVARVNLAQQAGFQTYYQRPVVLYNALNNNYVMWLNGVNFAPLTMTPTTSTSPEGPFTAGTTYTTINGLTSLTDYCIFQDDDSTAWLSYQTYQTTNGFCQLSADYTAPTTNFAHYNMVNAFGGFMEAPHMFKRAGLYYLIYSGTTGWQPNANNYAIASHPLGPWRQMGNPFKPVPGGVNGTYTDYTIAYDTQSGYVLKIPGRDDGTGYGAYMYMGDSWNNGVPSNQQSSTTLNQDAYTTVALPLVFNGINMSISWRPNWSYDQFLPSTITPFIKPLEPSGVKITGTTLTWINNELGPYALYVDSASDPLFKTNYITYPQAIGTTSFSNVSNSLYYRIRAVNHAGSNSSGPVTLLNVSTPVVTISGPDWTGIPSP